MTKKKKVSNKKKKPSTKKTKSCNKKCTKDCAREKVYGQPNPIIKAKSLREYLNEDGEIYPKIFFKESLWVRFKRFIGLDS